jgi:hypothetical protein
MCDVACVARALQEPACRRRKGSAAATFCGRCACACRKCEQRTQKVYTKSAWRRAAPAGHHVVPSAREQPWGRQCGHSAAGARESRHGSSAVRRQRHAARRVSPLHMPMPMPMPPVCHRPRRRCAAVARRTSRDRQMCAPARQRVRDDSDVPFEQSRDRRRNEAAAAAIVAPVRAPVHLGQTSASKRVTLVCVCVPARPTTARQALAPHCGGAAASAHEKGSGESGAYKAHV